LAPLVFHGYFTADNLFSPVSVGPNWVHYSPRFFNDLKSMIESQNPYIHQKMSKKRNHSSIFGCIGIPGIFIVIFGICMLAYGGFLFLLDL
jgi:hypothetical protein